MPGTILHPLKLAAARTDLRNRVHWYFSRQVYPDDAPPPRYEQQRWSILNSSIVK